FFSSRRRHTRFSRDWSSDVCSSDLSDYLIIYKDEYIKTEFKNNLNLQLKNQTIYQVLDKALDRTHLTYKISGRQIVVFPKRVSAGILSSSASQDSLLSIRGRVYDTHEPPGILPGISIQVKGTTIGTSSDADGYFTIKAPKG